MYQTQCTKHNYLQPGLYPVRPTLMAPVRAPDHHGTRIQSKWDGLGWVLVNIQYTLTKTNHNVADLK